MNHKLALTSIALAALLSACGGDNPPAATATPAAAPAPAATELVIHLDETHRREAGVEVAPAGPQTIAEVLSVYGEIAPAADHIRRVAARYPGIARRVTKNIGDRVVAGETLLVVESNDSLEPYRITAPIGGRILDRQVNDGESLGDQTLFMIGDLSKVWAELAVFPHDAARVSVGQAVDLYAERGSEATRARVDYVAPESDPQRRSVRVRATLDNADGRWRPGQFVSAELITAEHAVALAVPQSALQELEGRSSVFVERDGGFVARPVVLGAQDRHYAEVREGLAAGEHVVVGNSFLLKSEWQAKSEE